jgi:hypothetical protein
MPNVTESTHGGSLALETLSLLPVQLSSWVERPHETASIQNLLASSRLVTLTGSGGCGKTRLALEVASQQATFFAEGARFVELANVVGNSCDTSPGT